jgi:NAD(P)H-dependent FMN reductase
LAELDGFIVLAAEYNGGPTAVLKNALDYAFKEWGRKPVAFIGYGGVGGARAVERLRLTCVQLQMVSTRASVHIGGADFFKMWKGEQPISDFAYLADSAANMLNELSWWAHALQRARNP